MNDENQVNQENQENNAVVEEVQNIETNNESQNQQENKEQEQEQKQEVVETEEKKENSTDSQVEEQESIQIAGDVIAVIAGVAVSEVSGVASMAGGFAGGISEVLSGKKNMAKGIKVDKDDNKVKIDVNIIVEYGTRIPDIAFEIQNRVKKAVENMTGMKVEEVNVHVQGVDINTKKVESEAPNKNNEQEENKTEQ